MNTLKEVTPEKVTAIITSFNRDKWTVLRALKSIETQTFPVFEIIVVDDNALVDGRLSALSLSIQEAVGDRAVYIKQPLGNAGANAARNLGIAYANGDYVAFLDDDDEWLPEKIERQIAVFSRERDEGLGMVFCGGICRKRARPEREKELNVDGNIAQEYDYYNLNHFVSRPSHLGLLRQDTIGSTSQPLIKKSVFEKVGLFDEKLPARQDYDMWLRISKYYKIMGIDNRLFVHNIHENDQISRSKKRAYDAYTMLYRKYHREYIRDPIAWLNVQENISKNQSSQMGNMRMRLLSIMRIAYIAFSKLCDTIHIRGSC